MICTKGNLHVFSDQDERLREMFPLRTLLTTTMGADQETKKLSTSISIGAKIRDVSISSTHMFILDEFGRLWSVGMNRSGQNGLGHKIDQSNPKLVPVVGRFACDFDLCLRILLDRLVRDGKRRREGVLCGKDAGRFGNRIPADV